MEEKKFGDLKVYNWRLELRTLIEKEYGSMHQFYLQTDVKASVMTNVLYKYGKLSVGPAVRLEMLGFKTATYWLGLQNEELIMNELYK